MWDTDRRGSFRGGDRRSMTTAVFVRKQCRSRWMTRVQILSNHVNTGWCWVPGTPVLGDGDREIYGASWPAILTEMTISDSVTDLVSKIKWKNN